MLPYSFSLQYVFVSTLRSTYQYEGNVFLIWFTATYTSSSKLLNTKLTVHYVVLHGRRFDIDRIVSASIVPYEVLLATGSCATSRHPH